MGPGDVRRTCRILTVFLNLLGRKILQGRGPSLRLFHSLLLSLQAIQAR